MCAQLLLQFQANSFKTLHVLWAWSEDMQCGLDINLGSFLARLHEVHRAIVVTSVVRVYVYVYVCVRVRVTLSVKVFYKSISLDRVDGSS